MKARELIALLEPFKDDERPIRIWISKSINEDFFGNITSVKGELDDTAIYLNNIDVRVWQDVEKARVTVDLL